VGVHPTRADFQLLCHLLNGQYLFGTVICDCGVWQHSLLNCAFHNHELLIKFVRIARAVGAAAALVAPKRPDSIFGSLG
jgi:hypothetical protein